MKKFTILMAAIALVCFSVPAMAVDWNFYGNARMETYWTSEDEKDVGDKSTDMRWDFQGNSRLGANVKADHIKAQVELGLGADPTGKTFSRTDGDDGRVSTRRAYGVWNFGAGTLKVGKDYSPITQFISNQAFDTDLGLLDFGAPYGGRHGQVALGFGGFEVAFITPKRESLDDPETGASTDGLPKRIIPKIEASWGMAFDAWNFKIMGGYNYYSIKNVDSLTNPGSNDDVDVTSYTIAGGGTFNFGPAYVGAQAQYGSNMGNAGWSASYTGYADALWDGDDDTNDVVSYGGILVAGMKVSDMLSFELGGGYMVNDPNDSPNDFDEKTKQYSVYLNSTIALAPGVFIIPEVGMLAFGNTPEDEDQGSQFYLGGKWQINF
jgi:hypothetical protein